MLSDEFAIGIDLDLLRALDALPGDPWETLQRIRRFALDKHPPEPRW